MLAVKLRGQATGDGHLVVELPEDLAPGPVEVIVLQDAKQAIGRQKGAAAVPHPAFGMWADREEAQDPAAFATELRRRIEQQADSRG